MNKLKEARERRGWSLRELSRRSGVSTAMLSRIEKGERCPSLLTAIKIVNTFTDLRLEDLVE